MTGNLEQGNPVGIRRFLGMKYVVDLEPGSYHEIPWIFTLYKLYAFPVRICIPGESSPHSRQGCAFPVRNIPIPGEDVHSR